MRFFKKKVAQDRFPDLIDPLKDADASTRIKYVLELWQKRSNGQFRFDHDDSQGKYSFPFRGAMIDISLQEAPGCALCRVVPQDLPPPLIVKHPVGATCFERLVKWFDGRIYSNLDLMTARCRQDGDQSTLMITTRACLTERHISAASLLHSLTEISDGYWHLAKAFFQSGLLNEVLSSYPSETRSRMENILSHLEDVKIGVLTGSLAKQLLPNDFPSMLKKEMVQLPFHNMVGDEAGGSIEQLMEYARSRGPEVARAMMPGHIDLYSISSKYLKDSIPSVTNLLKSIGKDFRLETIHQGFPEFPQFWDRKTFLAIRYMIKVADVRSVGCEELQEWRESLLFTCRPRVPTEYNIGNESVELVITLPFSIFKQANFVYPEFLLDNQTLELNNLVQNCNAFPANMKSEIDQMKKRVQMLK